MNIDMEDAPLVNAEYVLQKFPGKGGWTYAAIPEVMQDKTKPFGWVRVKGSIDGFVLSQYKLMPMGNGKLFLPVKASIRRKIGKEAGDKVHVILYADDSPIVIPEEIMDCFKYEKSELIESFKALSNGEQKSYIDWIYEAKLEETRAKRIAAMMQRLAGEY
jgi:hypothetical protein